MANDRGDNGAQESASTENEPTKPEDTTRPVLPLASAMPNTEGLPSRKEESGFSFKHFLRNSSDSATSSNLNGAATASSSLTGLKAAAAVRSSSIGGSSTQPNLGARPKVPHYSLQQQPNGLDQQQPRMKRSPKFPSFDSHAVLSEYTEEVSPNFVQRSHSNYEVETPSSGSFSRRSPVLNIRPGGVRDLEPPLCNSPAGNANRSANDFQAALPDFVKDHMVLEQWYQTNPFRGDANELAGGLASQGDSEDVDHPSRRNYHNSNLFDLAMGSVGGGGSSSSSSNFRLATNSPTVPLDLPTFDPVLNDRIQIPLDLPHHSRFGAVDRLSNPSSNNNHNHNLGGDIPLDLTERHRVNSRNDGMMHGESPPPQVQADMIQTLPDFLSDGPIHSSGRMADVAQDLPQLDSPEENAAVNVISRLRLENDRLRHELDEARRLISDQGRQINDLERTCRNGEIQRNGTMLERNKMNQKMAQLTVGGARSEACFGVYTNNLPFLICLFQEEIGLLKMENESLRDEGGAVGGNSSDKESGAGAGAAASSQRRPSQRMCQLLSMELKLAAGSAEANLRQLLAGVENLKLLARRVEDGMEYPDPIDDYMSDELDDDEFLGGAGSSSGGGGGGGPGGL